MGHQDLWERIYGSKGPTDVGWYQSHPELSLRFIASAGIEKDDRIIDVGGGASLLVDELLNRGFTDLTVLDISITALREAKSRLGHRAQLATWINADITRFASAPRFNLWHDRALFHFLTGPADRSKYIQVLNHMLAAGGHIVMATFALDGPPTCSGLEVTRYSAESLADTLGKRFQLQDVANETHITPSGEAQRYLYCRFWRSR